MNAKTTYKLDKETKGAVRYADTRKNSSFGPIYIRKELFAGKEPPREITIEVSF
ncbi:MAG TPA: hypothetical protein VMT62_08775 [Syntrophorhabdaceae bacterium]|nr:hypothetical protein [Syntrophorhabdaceae bacterium]